MICIKCGKTLPDDSTFCQFCGNKVDVPTANNDGGGGCFFVLNLLPYVTRNYKIFKGKYIFDKQCQCGIGFSEGRLIGVLFVA